MAPNAAMTALRRFQQAVANYVLATTHATTRKPTHATDRNLWTASGGQYASDLTAAPCNFPPPDVLLIDNETATKRWDDRPLQQLAR